MTLTVEQFSQKLIRIAEKLQRDNEPMKIATYTVLADQSKRIFTDGIKSDGSQIGKYNKTEPLYLNPDNGTVFNSGKLKPTTGKYGQHTFKNGRDHKTTFVESYSDYRERIGRESEFVNLELSGDMKSDFENTKSGIPTPIQINVNEYITGFSREINKKKREGNESRFGIVFFLTTQERDLWYKTLEFELGKLLSQG